MAIRSSLMGILLAIYCAHGLAADERLPPPKPGYGSQMQLQTPHPSPMAQPSQHAIAAPNAFRSSVLKTRQFNVTDVLNGVSSRTLGIDDIVGLESPWWQQYAERQIDPSLNPVPARVHDLIQLALQNSAQIRVYATTPEIRETAVTQAASAFDWSHFLDVNWSQLNEPVGSSLTVGDGSDRFRDQNANATTGFRRRLLGGGSFELSQRIGYQDTNSTFFIPNDQSTARLVLNYTQPLLRGHGKAYNTSLTLLARIDVARSRDEYRRQLQQHLLEVARGYWTLYLERAKLAQKISLYLKTQTNVDQLTQRQAVDAQRSQLIQATAALESRKSDLIRAHAAVRNAETRLRALINAPHLTTQSEIVPLEHPSFHRVTPDLYQEFETAVRNRPEVRGALKEISAASVRLNMAKHEMMPVLNLVTNTYVAGLRGESRFGRAWVDQFSEGAPSYSVGLEWEMPIGRRAATANLRRRSLEKNQLSERYRASLELVGAEVEVAVREVNTSFAELTVKNRARRAAEAEAETLEVRWKSLSGRDNNASLMLQSLLQAQTRVLEAEEELARAQLTYSLSLINLRHANGTLLQMNGPGQAVNAQPVAYVQGQPTALPQPTVQPQPTAQPQAFAQHQGVAGQHPHSQVNLPSVPPSPIQPHMLSPQQAHGQPAQQLAMPHRSASALHPNPSMAMQQISRPVQRDDAAFDALMLGAPVTRGPAPQNRAANVGMAIDNLSR